MRPLITLPVMFLAACSAGTAAPIPALPGRINPPAPELMSRPAPLKVMREGDSIFDDAAVCRAEYGRLSSKVVALQNWVVVVTSKKASR